MLSEKGIGYTIMQMKREETDWGPSVNDLPSEDLYPE